MSLWEKLIEPMLAFPSEPFNSKDWLFEVKFDGTRTIAYVDKENKSVKFLNRRLKYFEHRYPELQKIWENLNCKRAILDGEIVVFEKGKPNFYKLAEREHVDEKVRIEILSKIIPANYIVFDILHLDGKDLIDLPLIERKEILKENVKEGNNLLFSVFIFEKGKEFFKKVKEQGLEGIMAKKIDSSYEIGKRSKNWLKIKVLKSLDCIIIGYTTGIGKREEFGSLICAVYHEGKLKYVGKVGTGFDESEIEKILEKLEKIKVEKCPLEEEPELNLPAERKPIWVKPKYVCEVKFMELTQDLQMRAPVFVRMREDKLPEDCELLI